MLITNMLSYHNDIDIKNKYIARIKYHRKAETLIRGVGYSNGKGCAVGCTLENYSHERYPVELGLPIWLAYLEDRIYEGVSLKYSKTFPERFLKAIPKGITEQQFTEVKHKLSVKWLTRLYKAQQKQYKKTPLEYLKQTCEALLLAIKYNKNPSEESAESAAWSARSAARSAAWSAESAAWSARSAARSAWSARSAAWSAAWSAESAAWSAESAAWSARSAESAARETEFELVAKELLVLLSKLKPLNRRKISV